MTVLGLETSTAVCSVGLYREGVPGVEASLQESHIHSEKLLTLVQQVVRTAGMTLGELDAIAVSIGPGSFTGLRIGLSAAKGLAFSLGKPLTAVPTFEAIAESARQWHPLAAAIRVVLDAKRDEWYVGEYRVDRGTLELSSIVGVRQMEEAIGNLENLPSSLVLSDKVAEIRRRVGEAVLVEDVHPYCRGSVVAALGARMIVAGDVADSKSLEPMYLKDFVVRTLLPGA